jgi:hypothetical protein
MFNCWLALFMTGVMNNEATHDSIHSVTHAVFVFN